MGTYYYLNNNKPKGESWPIYEDDYISALYSIAKKNGVIITDEMIYNEINNKKTEKKPRVKVVSKIRNKHAKAL